jgi:hypothetical protein
VPGREYDRSRGNGAHPATKTLRPAEAERRLREARAQARTPARSRQRNQRSLRHPLRGPSKSGPNSLADFGPNLVIGARPKRRAIRRLSRARSSELRDNSQCGRPGPARGWFHLAQPERSSQTDCAGHPRKRKLQKRPRGVAQRRQAGGVRTTVAVVQRQNTHQLCITAWRSAAGPLGNPKAIRWRGRRLPGRRAELAGEACRRTIT